MILYVNDINIVERFAETAGHKDKWLSYSLEDRNKLMFFASCDIEALHKQPRRSFDMPWLYGNTWLREACLYQIMFLARNKGMKEFVERAQIGSSQSFSDGIISLVNPGGKQFDSMAESIVNNVLKQNGICTDYEFERG